MSRPCGDCGVEPGWPHIDGCDVARCTECGWQRIGCEHEESALGWGQTWTGVWPGEAECHELGLIYANGDPMLNELAMMAHMGGVVWSKDQQRWERVQR